MLKSLGLLLNTKTGEIKFCKQKITELWVYKIQTNTYIIIIKQNTKLKENQT